jgi:AraC-like DNA-binding protein
LTRVAFSTETLFVTSQQAESGDIEMTAKEHERDAATVTDLPLRFACGAGGQPVSAASSDRELVISRDFAEAEEVGEMVPEARSKFTQISAGEFSGKVTRVELGDLVMHYICSSPETLNVSFTEADKSYFIMPFRWSGDLLWDGRTIQRPPLLYYPSRTEHVRRGRAVEGVAFAASTEWFESSVAALVGLDADEVPLRRGEIATSPRALEALPQLLLKTMAEVKATPEAFHDRKVQEMVAARIKGMLLSIVAAQPRVEWEKRYRVDATRIVRSAEEYFDRARDHVVSLADLCRASGVSARTLQYAFECICGMPPVQYFKRRRLSLARRALRQSEPIAGAVKAAALEAGFLHFGRFSADYQAMFGETPSETLNRSARRGSQVPR